MQVASPSEPSRATGEALFWQILRKQLVLYSVVGQIGGAGGAILVTLDLLSGGMFLKQTIWQNLGYLALMFFQLACCRMAYVCLHRQLDRSGGVCFLLGLAPPVLYALVDLLK